MSGAWLTRRRAALPARAPLALRGRVSEVTGLVVRATLDGVVQGELCHIAHPGGPLAAEVVALRGDEAALLPLGDARGVGAGADVVPLGTSLSVGAGSSLL